MPTACCVPQCNQKGVILPTGEKVSFLSFLNCQLDENSGFVRSTETRESSGMLLAILKYVRCISGKKISGNF